MRLNYHLMSLRTKPLCYKFKIGYRFSCAVAIIWSGAVFNVSVQIVLSLEVMGQCEALDRD